MAFNMTGRRGGGGGGSLTSNPKIKIKNLKFKSLAVNVVAASYERWS